MGSTSSGTRRYRGIVWRASDVACDTLLLTPLTLLYLVSYLEDGSLEDAKGLHAVDDPHEVDVLSEVYVLLYRDLRRRVDQVIPGLRVRVGVRG